MARRPAEARPRMGPPVEDTRFAVQHKHIMSLNGRHNELHGAGSVKVESHLSGTGLPSSLLPGLVLGGCPGSFLAFPPDLEQLLHASEPRQAGPAWPGCCSSPGAASGSDNVFTHEMTAKATRTHKEGNSAGGGHRLSIEATFKQEKTDAENSVECYSRTGCWLVVAAV